MTDRGGGALLLPCMLAGVTGGDDDATNVEEFSAFHRHTTNTEELPLFHPCTMLY